jgi:hypothetical protein
MLGDAEHAPAIDAVLRLLADGRSSAVVNLLGVALADRPAFLAALCPRLDELRRRTGRPHWIVVDEAHHMLAQGWRPPAAPTDRAPRGWIFITVHPETLARSVLDQIGVLLAVGPGAAEVVRGFALASDRASPGARLPAPDFGEILAWFLGDDQAPRRVRLVPTRRERIRHLRKYAAGELGEDRSFYFIGPHGRLKLRAQNLQMFMQIADGVDDDTWLHHLHAGDYSTWVREAIKDPTLARQIAAVEEDPGLGAEPSRNLIRELVEARYTAPA